MSVFFLHPIYLYGLLAASLPILIHLLNRRRMKRIRFPAVRFILLSQKRISRSYRLRHWLLLALRTMAIILLALLLANPIFQTGAGLFAGGGTVSLVILLDNSLSMTWSGDGSGFKQAKEAARLLIASLNDGDRAALIPTNISGKEAFRLKEEKEVLLRELQAIEIADGTANFTAALDKAYELLNVPAGQREIRLITDMGLTGWDQFSIAALKQYDPSIPLKTIRVSAKQKPLNGAVKEVKLGGQGAGVNLPLQIEAVLANFGAAEIKDLLVQLSIDGETKEQKLATVPPHGETSVNFQSRLAKPGSHMGEITLKKEGFAGSSAHLFRAPCPRQAPCPGGRRRSPDRAGAQRNFFSQSGAQPYGRPELVALFTHGDRCRRPGCGGAGILPGSGALQRRGAYRRGGAKAPKLSQPGRWSANFRW